MNEPRSSVLCGECGATLDRSYAATPRKPCPDCGSTKRTFHAIVTDTIEISDGVSTKTVPLSIPDVTKELDHLHRIYGERLRQARTAFNVAMILMVCGVVIVMAGAVMLLLGWTAGGVVTTVAGVINGLIGRVLFTFSNGTNDRLDKVGAELGKLERANTALRVIETISDAKIRDSARKELAKELSSS